MSNRKKLNQARQAFRQKAWSDAYSLLAAEEEEHPLEPEDLDLMAQAAYLSGKISACTSTWSRAHQAFLSRDNTRRAANCAFWLGMILMNQGDPAQGSGWISRAGRLMEEHPDDCPEKGFLFIPQGLQQLRKGDAAKAHELFSRAAEIGSRLNHPDLIALGRLGRGQALIQQGNTTEGTALFDESMVAVLSDEISPIVSGIVYCAVIETCQKIYDLHRAQEWTEALNRWCEAQPDLVPFRGQCMIRRVEILQIHGEWNDAMSEARRAGELLSQSDGDRAAGEAFYRQAELLRLRGDFREAEEMYRRASKWGGRTQPGLALLRLAQGQTDLAEAAIRRAEEETDKKIARSHLLPAYIEILLSAGDVPAAGAAAAELSDIATEIDAPFLRGIAACASGRVLLAEGKSQKALDKLREGCTLLKEAEAFYDVARTRELIGLACRDIGDVDTADMELDAAGWMFKQLGAEPDRRRVESVIQDSEAGGDDTHGLTPRELQVLRLLATGKTNSEIAKELFISERTVDRHVSNILSKLNVPSRAGATAYAYEHELL